MASSDITFETNDVSSIVKGLNSDIEIISSISDILKDNFKMIYDTDLFVEGFDKLNKKLDNLKAVHESIITAISGQAYTYDSVENMVSNVANDYMSYYSDTKGRKTSSGSHDNGNIKTKEVDESKKITSESLDQELANIDDKTLIEMINFININKDENMSFNDLLKEENSSILGTYLQEFYKSMNDETLTITDDTEVRKLLLEKILNTEMNMPQDVKLNSLIDFKAYLTSVAQSLNVDLYNLLYDEKYSDVVSVVFTNLYNGTAIGDTSLLKEGYSDSFKQLVEYKAESNNITTNEIINQPTLLI